MNVPRRIVLSRKGFDSTKGGGSGRSPVFDGRPFSIPIPQSDREGRYLTGGTTYGSLSLPHDVAKWTGVEDFGRLLKLLGRRNLGTNHSVHLDPDIRPEIRPPHFESQKAIFGQDGGALTELTGNSCSEGTLFLFFGLFQPVQRREPDALRFTGKRQHIIWGWMQVDEIVRVENGTPKWAEHHPHVVYRDLMNVGNSMYVASKNLSFADAPGFGEFAKVTNSRVLSMNCDECPCDTWQLPEAVMAGALTRPGNKLQCPAKAGHRYRPDHTARNYTGPGQEFIFDTTKDEGAFRSWLSDIFAPIQLDPLV
jgi:hypothetical protein